MADQVKTSAGFNDWLGILPNASPHRLKPGAAQEQTNLRIHVPGQAECRGGTRRPTFSNAISDVTDEIISMFGFQTASGKWIAYETTNGDLKIGKNPTL